MTEAEARDLARQINRYPNWTAVPRQNLMTHEWWVQAHHDAMRATSGSPNPFPTLPIATRAEWEAALAKWGT